MTGKITSYPVMVKRTRHACRCRALTRDGAATHAKTRTKVPLTPAPGSSLHHCHSERSEESLRQYVNNPTRRKADSFLRQAQDRREILRFAQDKLGMTIGVSLAIFIPMTGKGMLRVRGCGDQRSLVSTCSVAREISRPLPRILRLRPVPGLPSAHQRMTVPHSLRLHGRLSGSPEIFPIFSQTCRS